MPDEKLIDAVAVRDFTSTVFGNLSQGDGLKITQSRFNVWKDQGLVDYPKGKEKAAAVDEAPKDEAKEEAETAPAPKKTYKRKGKNRK